MVLLKKHALNHRHLLRDVRPVSVRIRDFWGDPSNSPIVLVGLGVPALFLREMLPFEDILLLLLIWYGRWVARQKIELPFKMPKYAAPLSDPHNPPPGKKGAGKSEGILFLGNVDEADNPDHGKELWITNTDARTHILYIGTTGSGKTEGLKAIVTNALAWGSGFVYVDGKADTDLWASLFALARRFGRDDDLLVLNYMTANSDEGAISNTMNPFSNGSASYLTNMVVSLMPDAGGDNAMWKERAIALLGALMPALTWKREKQGLLLDVSVLRDYIELPAIIRLSRDANLPERIIRGLQGYLSTLPGYIDAAFDDEGNERPPAPDQPMYDLQVARQQHGYLSMQFTRSLQSLGDEYGYIFKAQLADVDVLDIVLNRRILVALIPALEKSGDEAANLGKIVAASLKGMMGATLGNTVEGSWENAIGSKQTRSQSSFMTVFDEVGYYTAQGMAVMAAQARSLGFSLIFAAQDLPSMEKRIKQEAQSILANCNIKIFGKLEDPGDTKKFFQDHVGDNFVYESTGMTAQMNTISSLFLSKPFYENMTTSSTLARVRAHYDQLRGQREGEAHILFAEYIARVRMFYAQPEKVRALRVHKLLPVQPVTNLTLARERAINEVASRLKEPDWSARTAAPEIKAGVEIATLTEALAKASGMSPERAAMAAVGGLLELPAAPSRSTQSALVEGADPERKTPKTFAMPQEEALQEFSPAEDSPVEDEGEGLSFDSLETFMAHRNLKEVDTSIAPQIELENEDEDVTKLKLPDDIAALVEGMAEKLNKGLGEKER